MEARQNPTNTQNKSDNQAVFGGWESLTPQQQTLVDFKAVNGFIQGAEDNVPKKMSMQQLADALKVNRDTLYDWIKKIPNFWGLVMERRKIIGSQERLAKMHHTWYLKALSGSFLHLQLWLANFDPEFRMPTQKLEHDVGTGLADLLDKSRQRRHELQQGDGNMLEGEVVNEQPPVNN